MKAEKQGGSGNFSNDMEDISSEVKDKGACKRNKCDDHGEE